MWNAGLRNRDEKLPGLILVYDTILNSVLGKHPTWFLSYHICKMEVIYWKENDSNIYQNIVNEDS